MDGSRKLINVHKIGQACMCCWCLYPCLFHFLFMVWLSSLFLWPLPVIWLWVSYFLFYFEKPFLICPDSFHLFLVGRPLLLCKSLCIPLVSANTTRCHVCFHASILNLCFIGFWILILLFGFVCLSALTPCKSLCVWMSINMFGRSLLYPRMSTLGSKTPVSADSGTKCDSVLKQSQKHLQEDLFYNDKSK